MELWSSHGLLSSFSQFLVSFEKDRTKQILIDTSTSYPIGSFLSVYSTSTPSHPAPPPLSSPQKSEPQSRKETQGMLSPMPMPADSQQAKQQVAERSSQLLQYRIQGQMSELIVTGANFLLHSSDINRTSSPSWDEIPSLYTFADNLTIKILDLIVFEAEKNFSHLALHSPSSSSSSSLLSPSTPPLLISFHQYGLSLSQQAGVHYMIYGGIAIVTGLALAPLRLWYEFSFQRKRKLKQN